MKKRNRTPSTPRTPSQGGGDRKQRKKHTFAEAKKGYPLDLGYEVYPWMWVLEAGIVRSK